MQKIDIPVFDRECPSCLSINSEKLWDYDYTTKTLTKSWTFHVHNAICKECGFVFVSPVSDPKLLIDYYGDSFSKFDQQTLDYNISKRIDLIKKFNSSGKEVFIEVGANSKTEFHNQLQSIFQTVQTIEPNQSTESEYSLLSEVQSIKADCVAHYFVLEHIPDIAEFLRDCANILTENGIMICEVPSLGLYSQYISPLILFEHVNHFTPDSLARIADREGFKLLHQSHEDCSRPYGFVAVFQKVKTNSNSIQSEYEKNKSLFLAGYEKVKLFNNGLEMAWNLIQRNEPIIVWAANETTKRLFMEKEIPGNVTVIDSDPRKKDYLEEFDKKTYQAIEVKDKLLEAKHLIICTQLHAGAILNAIKENYNKEFSSENIRIVDII